MDVLSQQLSPTPPLLFPRAHKSTKERSSRNNTITLEDADIRRLSGQLLTIHDPVSVKEITNKTIWQDLFVVLDKLPKGFVDLLFIDPPYNLNKDFNGNSFRKMADDAYEEWVASPFSTHSETDRVPHTGQ